MRQHPMPCQETVSKKFFRCYTCVITLILTHTVRTFYNIINERCLKFRTNSKALSIDEFMLPYYGRNGSKQRIQGKPVCSGYKMCTLAEANGYVIQFDPYSGANSGITYRATSKTWGLGEVVILKLLDVFPEHVAYKF